MTSLCVCGREFAKRFGLHVHERTCPRARALIEAIEGCADDHDPATVTATAFNDHVDAALAIANAEPRTGR